MLSAIGLKFVDLLASLILSTIVDKFVFVQIRNSQIHKKLKAAIEKSLIEAIKNFPDAEFIFENFDVKAYLSNQVVINEIVKLITFRQKPDENILFDKWVSQLGSQYTGNLKIILQLFILNLKDQLRTIEEIREIIHDNDTQQILLIVEKTAEDVNKLSNSIGFQVSGTENTGDKDIKLESQVDLLVNLYKDGNPNACLRQLLDLTGHLAGKSVPDRVLVRIYATMGGCYIALENDKEGVNYLTKAFNIDPENPDMLANFSLAKMLLGEEEDALRYVELSLDIKPGQSLAASIKLDLLSQKEDSLPVEELINEEFLNNPEYLRTIGLIYLRNRNLKESEKYIRKSIAINDKDPYCRLILAQILIDQEPLMISLVGIPDFTLNNSEETRESLRLVEEALSISNTRDNHKIINNLKASRAGIRATLGNFTGALNDCNDVLSDDPDHLIALHNRALLSLQNRNMEEALLFFNKLPEDYIIKQNLGIPIISVYIEIGKYKLADDLINRYKPDSVCNEYFDYYVMKAVILIKENKQDEIPTLLSNLLTGQTSNSRAFEAAGAISNLIGDNSKAVAYYIESHKLSTGEKDKIRIVKILANLYSSMNEYDEALKWFHELPDSELYIETTSIGYASALYFIHNYGAAYDFVHNCIAIGKYHQKILEFHVWLSIYRGDLIEALEIQKLFVNEYPLIQKNSIELARLYYILDNHTDSLKTLNSIKGNLRDPWDLLLAAELFSLLGEYEVSLELAYSARRLGEGIAEIYAAYFSIFLHSDNQINLEMDLVKPNSAVLLNDGQENFWLTILDLCDARESNKEYSSDSVQARQFLGHKVGEVVYFTRNSIQNIKYKIIEIQSIFVRAFQDTINEFNFRFPNDHSIQKMQIVDNDITGILQEIARSDVYLEEIRKYYTNGAITLEQFATFINRDPIQIFISEQNNRDRIYASTGTSENQILQKSTVQKALSVTLSLTGLLTIKYLNLLELLPKRFENLYISQRLADCFSKSILTLDTERLQNRRIISFSDGQFKSIEITHDMMAQTITYLEQIISFIKSSCKIVPITPQNLDLLNPSEKPSENIGQTNISLILVSRQTETPLLSDDIRLTETAIITYGISGFWTQELLLDLQMKDFLSFGDYSDSCAKLAESSYYYLSISDLVIESILKKDGYKLTNRVDSLLRIFQGPETQEIDAINLLSRLLKKIWLSQILQGQKLLILDRVLEYLTTNRSRDRVIRMLLSNLKQFLLLAPFQYDDIKVSILQWIQQHPTNNMIMMGKR